MKEGKGVRGNSGFRRTEHWKINNNIVEWTHVHLRGVQF